MRHRTDPSRPNVDSSVISYDACCRRHCISISVETLYDTVMLSGFAQDSNEKGTAERIASNVDGVKSVQNEITVRS